MTNNPQKERPFFKRSDFIIVTGILLLIAGVSTYSLFKLVESETIELKRNLRVVSEDMANQVRSKMNRAFEINRFNKNYLKAASLQTEQHNISRAEVIECYREQLSDNSEFLGLYTLWEPNAFDNIDSEFKNSPFHDSTGRFVPYTVRHGSQIVTEACRFYDALDTVNYYYVSKNRKKEIILNPYTYPIDGKEVLMISAITPIIINGKFKGITGVDYTVDFLQKLISDLTLLENDVQVCIHSSDGIIIAIEGHPEFSGTKIQDLPEKFRPSIHFKELTNESQEDSDHIISYASIQLGNTDTSWEICVTAPKSIVYDNLKSAAWKITLVSAVLALFVLLLWKYYKSKTDAQASKFTLQSIIDHIQHSIWAIDKNCELTLYNQKFQENLKANYDVESGPNISSRINQVESDFWREKYTQCLNGATLTFEKKYSNGKSFQYWLYPLTVKNEIAEVMCISVEITEKEEYYEMKKKLAEYQITALHSVMNPHFLYNTLNSIQYYVVKSERKMALDSLSLFSSLIRKTLDGAITQKISLKTELEILDQYIKLEKLRFEEKFSYSFTIDDEVDLEDIMIPSLLIQPYVENAILHGLLNKDGPGFLKIDITMSENTLVVIIEDNGIGRKKSKELNDSNPIKEKPHGMLITKDRLDFINQTTKVNIKVDDMENSNKDAEGTRVTITIET